jgi:outer membrane protein assembly factor BamD
MALIYAAGCGGSDRSHLRYGDAAQSLYSEALEDFYSGNCLDAEPTFRKVRTDYPYSRFAALAELRLADCLFEDGKFVEAIQAYQQFVRHRPSHVEVPYARFKVAESYYEQIPDDWFLVPPAYERDQAPAQQTLRQLKRFLSDYKDDPHLPRARKLAQEALELLARHELYAANFYLDRDHPQAAIGRLQTLLRSYPKSSVEAEALFLLGETHLELEETVEARRAFQKLIKRFPSSEYADPARDHLASLGPG